MSAMPPRGQTAFQTLRIVILAVMGALVLLGVVLLLQVPHTSITDPVLTAVPAIAALLALATIPMVRRSILRPLPPGIKEPEARTRSAGAYRTATFAVFAIAEAPALLGYALQLISGPVGTCSCSQTVCAVRAQVLGVVALDRPIGALAIVATVSFAVVAIAPPPPQRPEREEQHNIANYEWASPPWQVEDRYVACVVPRHRAIGPSLGRAGQGPVMRLPT